MQEIERSKFYFNFSEKQKKEFTGILIDRNFDGKIKVKEYIVSGRRHRDDGPAVISVDEGYLYHHYYVNGKLISYDVFLSYQDMLKLKGLL